MGVPGLQRRLSIDLRMLLLQLAAPPCRPAWGRSARPKPGAVRCVLGKAVPLGRDSCPAATPPVRSPSVRRRHRDGDSCQPLRADRRLQIYYRSAASAKAHQARGKDAPGGDERIPSVEFMWNKLSTGDISS